MFRVGSGIMTIVKKRGGRKQNFSPFKVRKSIERAAKDNKAKKSKINQLLKDVAEPVINSAKKRRLVKAIDLRRVILRRLDNKARTVAQS